MQVTDIKATSVRGLSKLYDVGESTIWRQIRCGHLKAARVGRRVVVRIADFEEFLNSSQPKPNTESK